MDELTLMSDYYLEAERSAIGSVLIDPSKADFVLSSLKAEDFSEENRRYYWALAGLVARNIPVDPVTFLRTLPHRDKQEEQEQRQALMDIMDRTPTAANLGVWVEEIKSVTRLRKLHEGARAIVASPTEEGVGDILESMLDATDGHTRKDTEGMEDGLQSFFNRHIGGTKPEYLPTSLPRLDKYLRIGRGKFGILAGYPSDGKTALSLQMAARMAQEKRVGFFSLETDHDDLMDRLVANQTGADYERIQMNELTSLEWESISSWSISVSAQLLDRINASGYTVADIRARTRSRKYDVIIIDYLQLIKPSTKGSRYEQVTQISMDLHNLAQQLGVTVIALSQLTRPQDKTGKLPVPDMHDLRESGQIEQDADFILLLYETKLSDKQKEDGYAAYADKDLRRLKIAKNKQGRRARRDGGGLLLEFRGWVQQFHEITKPVAQEPPRQQAYEQTRMEG